MNAAKWSAVLVIINVSLITNPPVFSPFLLSLSAGSYLAYRSLCFGEGGGARVYDLGFLCVEVNQVHLLFNLGQPPSLPRARRKDRSLFVVTVQGGISKRKKNNNKNSDVFTKLAANRVVQQQKWTF